MPASLTELFESLFEKDNGAAYRALLELQRESEETDGVYRFMDRLDAMLDSDSSYLRTRGLTLIAYNARWDTGQKIDGLLGRYLEHITDSSPVTARQCVKLLPMIARNKPGLKEAILSALRKADLSVYAGSMRPLIRRDIQNALAEIQKR